VNTDGCQSDFNTVQAEVNPTPPPPSMVAANHRVPGLGQRSAYALGDSATDPAMCAGSRRAPHEAFVTSHRRPLHSGKASQRSNMGIPAHLGDRANIDGAIVAASRGGDMISCDTILVIPARQPRRPAATRSGAAAIAMKCVSTSCRVRGMLGWEVEAFAKQFRARCWIGRPDASTDAGVELARRCVRSGWVHVRGGLGQCALNLVAGTSRPVVHSVPRVREYCGHLPPA
jgi:hypothetical protein